MKSTWWMGGLAGALLAAPSVWADEGEPAWPGYGRGIHIAVPHVNVDIGPGGLFGREVQVDVDHRDGPVRRFAVPREELKLGEYWLGLMCHPAPATLGKQLGLPEGHGLVVEKVLPDTPATKAGIQRHDVLVSLGGKSLGSVVDLIQATEAAGGKAIAVELIRGGKRRTLEVTPRKRPVEVRPEQPRALPDPGEWDHVQDWLDRFLPGRVGVEVGPMRYRFLRPGLILPRDAEVRPALPEDTRVTIVFEGDKPARVTVRRGDEKWTATEGDLEPLPEDIRPHVERLLGRASARRLIPFDLVPDWEATEQAAPEAAPEAPAAPPLEQRMREMDRRLEQLRNSIEELRRGQPETSNGKQI